MFLGSSITDAVNFFNVHNYIKNDLVYIGTPKCGSRYYTTLLLENEWHQINLWDIDWNKVYAFGFIREPLERYLKGIVQDIFESESKDYHTCVTKMIGEYKNYNLPMSFHALPITVLLNGYYDKINWIPIGENSHQHFLNICHRHGISISKYDSENIDPHHSTPYKQQCYEHIKSEFDQGNDLYHLFYEQDHKIFEAAKLKFA